MAPIDLQSRHRLAGTAVFLSASVPVADRGAEFQRTSDAQLRIEEAVMGIARAIFFESGTLVFGAHPSISPLVATIVAEYYRPRPPEPSNGQRERPDRERRESQPSVHMFQSDVWKELWAPATEALNRQPLVRLSWIDRERGERIDPAVRDAPQAPRSMRSMRIEMISRTSPVAMIAVGGMDGVIEEARIFSELRPGRPIFTFVSTGGASSMLRRLLPEAHIVVVDREGDVAVRAFWQERRPLGTERATDDFYVPYSLIAQQTIAKIVDGDDRGDLTER